MFKYGYGLLDQNVGQQHETHTKFLASEHGCRKQILSEMQTCVESSSNGESARKNNSGFESKQAIIIVSGVPVACNHYGTEYL